MENNENKPTAPEAVAQSETGGGKSQKAKDILQKMNVKYAAGALILLLIVGYAAYAKNPDVLKNLFTKNLTQDQAKAKATDFVKNNMVAPGTDVSIKNISDESGLYKLTLNVAGQEYTSYMTKDGKTFFVQGVNIADTENKAKDKQQAAAPKDVPKSDKPDVKLFVMSYCPYGTQIEKGIIPVVKALGDKINFTLEFVNYAMHNDLATNDRKELDENLRQYCIQKNQPAKLDDYLTCFLKKGKGTESSCMATAGVNAAQVNGCMAQADAQFNVTKDFKDKSTYKGNFPMFEVNKADNEKYGVQGSPTLIINDVEAQAAGRDSASLLKTICSAFNNQPKECQTQLSSTAPAPGFGDGAAPANTNSSGAACGS